MAKCCHFDELELELANCFHSTGQVSHALNLNVPLVRVALPLLCFLEVHIRTAATVCTHMQTPAPLSDFLGAFLIRVFLTNLRCSFQFPLPCSRCFMPGDDYGSRSSFSCELWGCRSVEVFRSCWLDWPVMEMHIASQRCLYFQGAFAKYPNSPFFYFIFYFLMGRCWWWVKLDCNK